METSSVHVMSLLADELKFLKYNRKIKAETKMLFSQATIDKENVRLHSEVQLQLSVPSCSSFYCYCDLLRE
jgi:hypothetical protein